MALNLSISKSVSYDQSPILDKKPMTPEYEHSKSNISPALSLENLGISKQGMDKIRRGERKPFPEDQKDTKYYERRLRNNLAAKKSRDARKIREESISNKVNQLEQENAMLRAQVTMSREELRQLVLLSTGPGNLSGLPTYPFALTVPMTENLFQLQFPFLSQAYEIPKNESEDSISNN